MKTARIVRQTMIALAAAAAAMPPVGARTASPATAYINSNFSSVPMNLVGNDATPLVMLNMSRDHQLSYRAYTDYADLNGDGAPETTYTDTIEYYGYFDSAKCYEYSAGGNRFVPAALAGGSNSHSCSGRWSGNFLNWATMTRMDVVRKLLYGGKRSTDTAALTVLERQYLPTDAHAFAKYYNGETAPISAVTPFAADTIPPEADGASIADTGGNTNASPFVIPVNSHVVKRFIFSTSSGIEPQVGDQIKVIRPGFDEATDWMIGTVTVVTTSGTDTIVSVDIPAGSSARSVAAANSAWRLRNLSRTGISLCNLTKGTADSQVSTDPPMIRVARGNYALWNANERWQCNWSEEQSNTAGGYSTAYASRSNGNLAAVSGLAASSENPSQADVGLGSGSNGSGISKGEYVVRVEVGKAGLLGQEKIKPYGPRESPSYKPIGLLQVYADQLNFGLMTGSYSKNVSGGVLRKNISNFNNEINPVDGTFNAAVTGIVANLDRLRMYGYRSSGADAGTYIPGDSCTYQQIGFVHSGGAVAQGSAATEGNCSSWGNPMSEIYLESLRYLAGKTANPAYLYANAGSKDNTLGLTQAAWVDPLSSNNYCAPINILNFNAGVSGYDNDQIDTSPGWPDICATKTARALTDELGGREHLDAAGTFWFIGSNGTTVAAENNQLCSAKPVGGGFGAFTGLCPEAPTQKGAYLMAGMAWYANTNRIRADLEIPPARAGSRDLMAATYGVALSTNVPKIEVKVGGKTVTILPAYRLDLGNGKYGGGTLVDFKIVEREKTPGYGKYYVNWEDSEQGGDYDMDMWGIIEYRVIDDSTIRITTRAVAYATANPQGFGYVISGTGQDGAHFHSGILHFKFTDPTGAPGCTGANGCNATDAATSVDYTVGASTASLLQDPLWYAAKWGGPLANGEPTLKADGSPANYFYAINPLQLENALNRVFLDIVKRTASGTAAAVVANNVSGTGALYQAYYEPLRQDAGRQVSWVGTVQAFWLDRFGYLREDNGDGMLGGYQTDPVIDLYYDATAGQTKVRRYVSTQDDRFTPHYMQGRITAHDAATGTVTFSVTGGSKAYSGIRSFSNWAVKDLVTGEIGNSATATTIGEAGESKTITVVPPASPPPQGWLEVGNTITVMYLESATDTLANVRPLWNARKQLSRLQQSSGPDDQISAQRPFAAKADTGRFIKTWIDADGDSAVVPGEFIDFAGGNAASIAGYLGVDAAEAANVIEYIRGREIEGYRNRTVDYDGTGNAEVMRLGDVVNSMPTVVASPRSGLDLLYRDASYTVFKKRYANRRQMVYVGANDGMLHAFNGGFFDADNKTFAVAGTGHNGAAATEHPLGAEIWAYVPMNLLPHLRWLTQSDYQHTYYVDGRPKVFDAKIFADDFDHPGGWGTVLVVGMRFGGGPIRVDTSGGTDPSAIREFRSAYVILDVTNPEVEPKLLAELQVPDASFSTSYPAVLTVKDTNAATDANKWFLVFGSGPTPTSLSTPGPGSADNFRVGNVLGSASSANSASLFIFDLAEAVTPGSSAGGTPPGCTRPPVGSGPMHILACDTGVLNSFTGDPITVDWDLDYRDNSIYFGTAGDASATSGRLMRMDISTAATPAFDAANPANWSGPVTVIKTDQPIVSAPVPTQDGAKPPRNRIIFGTGRYFVTADQASTATQSLYGVIDDGAEVAKTALLDVTGVQVRPDGAIDGLVVNNSPSGIGTFNDLKTAAAKGWRLDLPPISGAAGVAPATRILSSPTLIGGIVYAIGYQPSLDRCAGEGESRLYGLYYTTGTADPNNPVFGVDSQGRVKTFEYLGTGIFYPPVYGGRFGDIQGSHGEHEKPPPRPAGTFSGMESWREK